MWSRVAVFLASLTASCHSNLLGAGTVGSGLGYGYGLNNGITGNLLNGVASGYATGGIGFAASPLAATTTSLGSGIGYALNGAVIPVAKPATAVNTAYLFSKPAAGAHLINVAPAAGVPLINVAPAAGAPLINVAPTAPLFNVAPAAGASFTNVAPVAGLVYGGIAGNALNGNVAKYASAPAAIGVGNVIAGGAVAAVASKINTGAVVAPVAGSDYGYAGTLNLNTKLIDHPNGAVVPVDEPAVAAARAAHLASKSAAGISVAPVAVAYTGPKNLNTQLVDYPNGAVVPVDEPAVAAARASHLASKSAAGAGVALVAGSDYGYAGALNLNTKLIDHPNGAVVPVDEPAVVAARASHLASKSAAVAPVVSVGGSGNGYAGLVSHPNGAVVPVDEPAVAAARAAHLGSQTAPNAPLAPVAALVYGYTKNGGITGNVLNGGVGGYAEYAAAPAAIGARLVTHRNGAVVPKYVPAVAAARSAHLAAY